MPRPSLSLDSYKDLIITLFREQDLPTEEIARRLTNDHGLNISERTVSRRLTEWGVTRKKIRTPATQELRDRLLFHYNRNLNDAEIVKALKAEGYEEVKPRNLARLRQKLNLRRRARFSDYGDESDEFSGQLQPASSTTRPAPKTKNTPKSKAMAAQGLIPKVTAFVEQYMSKYDGSHDFNHIRRVVGLAHRIYTEVRAEPTADGEPSPPLDLQVVTLAALLHDVGDKKYLEEGQDSNTLVLATLLGFGAEEELAIKVQRIVLGVSYSSEIKNPAAVVELIQRYPELAVVQDADRLDAIGAVGIGRTFTFGGAKGAREMGDTIQHFDDKLEKLEGMMKTASGRKMARERTARLTMFKSWWAEEEKEAEGLLKRR